MLLGIDVLSMARKFFIKVCMLSGNLKGVEMSGGLGRYSEDVVKDA